MTHVTADALKSLEFFGEVPEAELQGLATAAHMRRLETGEALFNEGDELHPALRFLTKGGLTIRKVTASGKETVLRLIRTGELFGVAALFDRKRAPGTATATEASEVLEIGMDDMLAFVAEHPQCAVQLLVVFAQRLRESQDQLHAVVSERARTRLARQILCALDAAGGDRVADGIKLKVKLPHATLSRMVGITYEECVRLVREWTQEPSVLRYERGGVVVVRDRAALEEALEAVIS